MRATIREVSRLEPVGEPRRHARKQRALAAPAWLRAHADPAWVERYGQRSTEYRLPQVDAERQAVVVTIGQAGDRLLAALAAPTTPIWLRALPAAPRGYPPLRQGWVQPSYRWDDPAAPVLRWRMQDELPPTAQIISSPDDVEARDTTKRETTWVGYPVQLTETCEDATPNLITQVTATPASADDHTGLAPLQANLAARDLLPAAHDVDSG